MSDSVSERDGTLRIDKPFHCGHNNCRSEAIKLVLYRPKGIGGITSLSHWILVCEKHYNERNDTFGKPPLLVCNIDIDETA